MSADNGVYILKTADQKYRVAHAQAIEDLHYNVPKGLDMNPFTVMAIYGLACIFDNYDDAVAHARSIEKDLTVCEYGICDFESDNSFADFIRYFGKAKTPLERECLQVLEMAYIRLLQAPHDEFRVKAQIELCALRDLIADIRELNFKDCVQEYEERANNSKFKP